MTDIQKRITTFENDCLNNHADQYEGCLDCAKELKAIITELTEQNKKLVDALKFYEKEDNYNDSTSIDFEGETLILSKVDLDRGSLAKLTLQELNKE